jgi:prephenate dehydrogenase
VNAGDSTDQGFGSLHQVTIVGTGLLGVSLAMGLRAAGFAGRIVGVGRRSSTLERAEARGCFDDTTKDIGSAVAASQLVVLATPLGTFTDLLGRIAGHDHDDLVITDVGSTKAWVCAEAARLLPHPARFVGSHPMAGSEKTGPEAATATLYAAKPCIITPQGDTDGDALARVRSIWRVLAMRIVEMSPDEHDRKTACISHLPHAVACLLVELAQMGDALDMASTGFGDTTRVAAGDPKLWTDIFTTNRRHMIESLDALSARVAEFRRCLDTGDDDQLLAMLDKCKAVRVGWAADQRSV